METPHAASDFDQVAAHRASLGTAWRWETAHMPPSPAALQLLSDLDGHVVDAHQYLALSLHDGSADARLMAFQLYPDIATAEGLHNDPPACELLKIMVLGNCDPDEIAAKMGLTTTVVEIWERLFFDVRAVRDALGWIAAHVIRPEEQDGHAAFVSKLKAAFTGGENVARQILECNTSLPLGHGTRLFDRQLRLDLKLDEALAMPLTTSQDAQRFLQWHMQTEIARERLALDRQKFELRVEEIRRKSISQMNSASGAAKNASSGARSRKSCGTRCSWPAGKPRNSGPSSLLCPSSRGIRPPPPRKRRPPAMPHARLS